MTPTDISALRGKRVFVGLSGGVDSAVTAALLQKAGVLVTAVFIKGWYPPDMPCTWKEDRRDAMRVAAHLRLPFITLDASDEYKKGVIDYLLREYKAGRTPNPDIMCNKEVKFGAFHTFALGQGAEAIATGHYAQAVRSDGMVHLYRGVDPDKDQSYFLWAIPKKALANTYFPLGGMQKKDVRKLAVSFKLPNAEKRDSQGICFLGNVSMEDFLTQEFGTEPGAAVDAKGEIVGTHGGALLSTLGQRVHLTNAAPGPWYVISKDIEANTLTVSKEQATENRHSFQLTETNWFSVPEAKLQCDAQYRYHGPKVSGALEVSTSTFTPTMPVSEAIAAGQSLVIYENEKCIGGGIIA